MRKIRGCLLVAPVLLILLLLGTMWPIMAQSQLAQRLNTRTSDTRRNYISGNYSSYVSDNTGALVLVAGRFREDDPLQDNIHNVTNTAYNLFHANGYSSEQIYYLATDLTLDGDDDGQPDVDDLPSDANLEYAITQWAVGKVSSDRFLSLYLMNSGAYDTFYLDRVNGEELTPEELDGWLDQLEVIVPGVKVNIVVDQCHAGSFIDQPQTVSQPGRVIIASTSAYGMAYASENGAIFSDAFLDALGPDVSLWMAFEEARAATQATHPSQTPWLDDDGDGVANDAEDGQEAAGRILFPILDTPVLISEVLYDPLGMEPNEEWIEIYNNTSSPMDLTDWTISDNMSTDVIPTVTIPVGGCIVIAVSEDFYTNYPDFTGDIVFIADGRIGDGLGNTGDRLILKDNEGTVIDQMSYGTDPTAFDPPCPDVAAGHSLERSPANVDTDTAVDWIDQEFPNPGAVTVPTPTPTVTATPTSTPTPTPTPTPTATATPTPTPTFTITSTPTDTPTPPPGGDDHEPDDTCAQAKPIATDGTVQVHTFHQYADKDWVSFQAISGTTYLIEAHIPADSQADVVAELYDQCAGLPLASQDYAFSPGVRLQFQAPASGTFYLKLLNHTASVFGPDVAYHFSVRALSDEPMPGALVLVAGRLRENDDLQSNIHHVTHAVRRLFLAHGYNDDRIYYLATDFGLEGVDALPSAANLEAGITNWALDKVGSDRPFTLYLMDHGYHDRFYLDDPRGEMVTPQEIRRWLDQLEAAAPGVKVNVIVEACYSGSFIDDGEQMVSTPERVVIASTGAWNSAYPSDEGAIFSDHFIAALDQEQSLYASFQTARWAVQAAKGGMQTPWLDDDGDSMANGPADGEEAARRGFAFAGTLGGEEWPPYVVRAIGPGTIDQGRGVIQAEVRDNRQVRRVWAVIYPPSYQPPEPSERMPQEDLPTIVLLDRGSDWYGATYTGFDEIGTYRVVIHAEDDDGFEARPLAIEVTTGWAIYLPLILRQSP